MKFCNGTRGSLRATILASVKLIIHFKTFAKQEPVDLYITHLDAVATNLNNSRDLKQPLPAGLQASGKSLGGGEVTIALKMNPLAAAPTFELNASLTNVDLVALNSFLRSYGKLDVAGGQFALFTTTASVDGNYKGGPESIFPAS